MASAGAAAASGRLADALGQRPAAAGQPQRRRAEEADARSARRRSAPAAGLAHRLSAPRRPARCSASRMSSSLACRLRRVRAGTAAAGSRSAAAPAASARPAPPRSAAGSGAGVGIERQRAGRAPASARLGASAAGAACSARLGRGARDRRGSARAAPPAPPRAAAAAGPPRRRRAPTSWLEVLPCSPSTRPAPRRAWSRASSICRVSVTIAPPSPLSSDFRSRTRRASTQQ